jgi:hypothetical protein
MSHHSPSAIQIKQVVTNESQIRINLPKSINKDTEKISVGLVMMVDDSSNNNTNFNLMHDKNDHKQPYINETQRQEKKQGSFKKVINRIVESGFNVAKSRSHLANTNATASISLTNNKKESQYHSSFELINGFETTETKNDAIKLSKKNSIFKSNSLTRKNSIGLAKSSTDSQQQKYLSSESPAFLFNGNSNKIEIDTQANTDSNSTKDNDVKIRQSKLKKSNSLSASLPSRNFKFKEDIKSLFDKFTNPSSYSSNKNKAANSQMASNEGISSIVYSTEQIDKKGISSDEKKQGLDNKPEIVKIYRNEINSSIQRNNSQKVLEIKKYSDSFLKWNVLDL